MSRLDEIREREEKATRGPWRQCGADGPKCQCCQIWSTRADIPVALALRYTDEAYTGGEGCTLLKAQSNADFIAHAREDIPWLLAEIKRLELELNLAEEIHYEDR